MDGKSIHKVENKQPKFFYKMKVYSGDPWKASADGKIKNLFIETEGETAKIETKGRKIHAYLYKSEDR